jgi:deuterolysin
MKVFANIVALAALAAAAPPAAPNSPTVEVKLEMQDNSNVKAVVTNMGSEEIKIFKHSGLLGKGPIRKVQVSSAGELASYTYKAN